MSSTICVDATSSGVLQQVAILHFVEMRPTDGLRQSLSDSGQLEDGARQRPHAYLQSLVEKLECFLSSTQLEIADCKIDH